MPPTHQTIRLSRGRHASPDKGACVMELASMLAGEPFSDHPACASPVIGAFLRTYNDAIDDDRRQTLYRYAAMVVGTRAADDVEAARGVACASWAHAVLSDSERSRWRRWRLSQAAPHAGMRAEHVAVATGRLAGFLCRHDGDSGHARVLAFVDELVAMGQVHGPESVGRTGTSASVYAAQRKPVASGRGASGLAGRPSGGSSSL